ncbi:MAG: CorA family divalent cation transporter [Planctomycetota bacterium]
MINHLMRDEAPSMTQQTQLFMRDCYDHVVRLVESIESYREVCSDLRAYHLSIVGNRTNDVMKTLTIVSSIFIPLGFIAGFYGMNFQNMPELHWRYGYPLVIALMISIASGLIFWFYRKGWFND